MVVSCCPSSARQQNLVYKAKGKAFIMQNTSLMIQGTGSDVGKSILVAGLCRVYKRKGISVAPFKPQNMALNSVVTVDNGEIARAQALQALACGLEPHSDFNPVLLKPCEDEVCQVILQGQAVQQLDAKQFGNIKELAFSAVLESYQRLCQKYDRVIIEGAGSPAEINLRKNDIANMGFAEAVNCPVILAADIDKGGVFAQIVGTLQLLSPSEQKRIQGFIINKFRGNFALLDSGLVWLKKYTQKKLIGVMPYLNNLRLDSEDSIPMYQNQHGKIKIKIPIFSRISNHTDFLPLMYHPEVEVIFVRPGESLLSADLIILPGSKHVRSEMGLLMKQHWDKQIKQHLRYGGKVLGICGGLQLLGKKIDDPQAIEGSAGSCQALSLLDFSTTLLPKKQLKRVSGTFTYLNKNYPMTGYEVHCGTSEGRAWNNVCMHVCDQHNQNYAAGIMSDDGQIIATYLHGLFEQPEILQTLLHWVSETHVTPLDWKEVRHHELERLADCLEEHLSVDTLFAE